MTYKQLYTQLLENDDLFEMFNDMVGNWLEDKDNFIQQQSALESLANNTETDYEGI